MANTYETTVTSVEHCGADVLMVRLERPQGYDYRSGQWFRLTLDSPDGPQTRTLSHAACGHDDWIDLATRLSTSAFKTALADLVAGDRVQVSAPGGRLKLPKDAEKVAFLAGGVGITPVRSLLREAVAEKRRYADAVLIYGNRDESCEPYLGELQAMEPSGLRVVRVLEHPREGWEGESGFITTDLVASKLQGDVNRPFLVAGPPVMVTAMELVLDALGVSAEHRYVEKFGP